jgi:protein TonB
MKTRSIILSIMIHLIILGAVIYFYKRLEDIKADLPNKPMTAQIITRKPVIPKPTHPIIQKIPITPIIPKNPIQPAIVQPQIERQAPIQNQNPQTIEPDQHIDSIPLPPPTVYQPKSARIPPPIKGDIFDTDIIEKHSMQSRSAPDSGNIALPDMDDISHGGITFQVDNMKYYGYLAKLKETIQGKWEYPLIEQHRGNYGDLILEFTINKDGTLFVVRLIRTSGHRSLDDAAIDSIKNSAPFWPLPDDWHAKTFTIKGHFVYILNMMRRY